MLGILKRRCACCSSDFACCQERNYGYDSPSGLRNTQLWAGAASVGMFRVFTANTYACMHQNVPVLHILGMVLQQWISLSTSIITTTLHISP